MGSLREGRFAGSGRGGEKESEGWGRGEGERRLGEWRRRAKDRGVEKES